MNINITIEELLMLLGDREVQIYNERKNVEFLKKEIEELKKRMQSHGTDKDAGKAGDQFDYGRGFNGGVVEHQQSPQSNTPKLRDIHSPAQTAKGV